MRNRKRVGWHRYINGVIISTVVTVIFILIPLYWLIASSFKAPNSVGNSPPSYGPTPFSFANYSNAFVGYDFGIYFRNSIIVTLATTALVLVLGTLAGYALGRLPMRGKFTTLVILLIISVFPAVAVLAPLYLLMRDIGWLNSYQGLILPYTAFNLPFAIWILRNYMLGIPRKWRRPAASTAPGHCAPSGRSSCRRPFLACSRRASSASPPAGPSSSWR